MLTSAGFENEIVVENIKRIIKKPFKEIKMLVIPTARKNEYNKEKYMLDYINLGFVSDNIIFFNDENPNSYKNLDIDLIYVCGGNTFLLQKYLKKSGFNEEIKKYISRGVIYLGASAGTHIATTNIEHVNMFDENFVNINDYQALNLFNGIIICHYSEEREKAYRELKRYSKYKVYTLKDKELIYKEGEKVFKI